MGKSHLTWVRTVSIDESLREYRIRLTRNWVKGITEEAAKSALLSEYVFDLVSDLRAVELTASMPYTVVAQLDTFASGFIKGAGETTSQQVARAIAARLINNLDVKDAALREGILAECLQIGNEPRPIRTTPDTSSETIWKDYLQTTGFRLALSSSQSFGIAATYNAYENFLVRCVSSALGMSRYRKKSDDKFILRFTEAFGEPICNSCFIDEPVQMLRALRHTVSHNGGRETQELIDLKHPLNVVDRYLQFMP